MKGQLHYSEGKKKKKQRKKHTVSYFVSTGIVPFLKVIKVTCLVLHSQPLLVGLGPFAKTDEVVIDTQ